MALCLCYPGLVMALFAYIAYITPF
ncbi:uncharacterized protein FTOL_11350 [Fusarium torulosum]|uniref:Uncharacterized protein n=1 Tax=Fusarium torulosum TaxID=33205 RepID=A0AAE8MK04_9HYPO|nr:uncharacterized protein FTOL_11350 [Fusarium torulosum]